MAFDVLQRWHESSHVNTSGYNIQPARMTPVPRTGAWTYINEALSKILPQLDPVEIGRRKMALQQMREYNAQAPYRQAYQQYQMSQIPVLQARGEAEMAKANLLKEHPEYGFRAGKQPKKSTLSEEQLEANRNSSEKYYRLLPTGEDESMYPGGSDYPSRPPAIPSVPSSL